jgi:NADH dehydrogenase
MARAAARVLVLGGGFGGLFAARRLAERGRPLDPPLAITLVDRADRFVFKPLLYELLTDEVAERDIAVPIEEVLGGEAVRVVRGEVRGIDLAARAVEVAGESPLGYDALVIALGAEPFFRGLPGLAEHALHAATLEDFRRLRAHLDSIRARIEGGAADLERLRTVGICGAGPSGVEIACKIADLDRRLGLRVTLIEASAQILPGFGEELRAVARARLEEAGIALRLSTPVRGASEAGLALDSSETLAAATIVWTAGQRPAAAIRALATKKDPQGRALVGATLELPKHPGVFVLGDGAKCVIEGLEAPPATAQVAVQQAAVVARNVRARLAGRTLSSYRYFPLAETLSLGRGQDAFHVLGLKLGGRAGHVARRLVYLARLPGWRHRAGVGARWGARWAWEAAEGALARWRRR